MSNSRDHFEAMMREARVAQGLTHPENDIKDEVQFPTESEVSELEKRLREEYGEDFTIQTFDMTDPEDRAQVTSIFEAFYDAADEDDDDLPEGDLMEHPGEDGYDDLFESVLGNSTNWLEAPEPLVGESFEDYLERCGLFEMLEEEEEDMPEVASDSTANQKYSSSYQQENPSVFDLLNEAAKDFAKANNKYNKYNKVKDHAGHVGRSIRSETLQAAEDLVNGDRNAQYGDPTQDFQRTADLWTSYLHGVMDRTGLLNLEPHDIAVLQILLKISRLTWSPNKADHWIDIAGYAACGADCADSEFDGLV